ncbi:hypothetical protein JFU49_27240 [Pseudomonas sp. TH03]|uniref:hypothetical protein n=1 Tax=Pseudomonas sp. TH03 TaxID=2796369 RepID=UPI0019122A5F|nr:hypothetical protein [Pseudomonas sp. TH03]MBK5553947.1 hypothetical protein [Pseudomonas sp. TH03]
MSGDVCAREVGVSNDDGRAPRTLDGTQVLPNVINTAMFIDLICRLVGQGVFPSQFQKSRMPDQSRKANAPRAMNQIKVGTAHAFHGQAIPGPLKSALNMIVSEKVFQCFGDGWFLKFIAGSNWVVVLVLHALKFHLRMLLLLIWCLLKGASMFRSCSGLQAKGKHAALPLLLYVCMFVCR